MNEEAVQIKARFSRLTDEELLRVLTTERAEYRRVALDLAAAELSRRGISAPPAPFPERRLTDDIELSEEKLFPRGWLLRKTPLMLMLVAAGLTSYVVDTLWNPGDSSLRPLLYFTLTGLFFGILLAVWKKFFPVSYERVSAEDSQGVDDTETSERLKAELRAVAEDARDMLGLDWEARDAYADAYGYHIDFYDEAGRLRAAVFERPPGQEWDAEAVAQRLHELSQAPQQQRLPQLMVGGLSHYE